MRKLALALVCLVSVAFFSSCGKTVEHPEPSVNFLVAEGYVATDAEIQSGEPFMIGISAKSNVETQKLLTKCFIQVYSGDDRLWDTLVSDINKDQYNFDGQFVFEGEGVITISATVTDAANETAECKVNLTLVNNLEAVATKWVRRGANVTEGEEQLKELGLTWAGSYKEIFATLKPAEGYAMYMIDAARWDGITSMTDKVNMFNAAMEAGPSIESFRGITTAHSDNYDVIIGTIKGEEMHLMHITRCDVETGDFGTQLTITGEAK